MKLSYCLGFFCYKLFTVQKHLPLLGGNVPNGHSANYLQVEFVSVFHLKNYIKRLIFNSYSLSVVSACNSYPAIWGKNSLAKIAFKVLSWYMFCCHRILKRQTCWCRGCTICSCGEKGTCVHLYLAEMSLKPFIEKKSVRGEIDWILSLWDPILPLLMKLILLPSTLF